ncbi:Calcium-transporting ATPase 2 [Labeo rohita]|uniref:Calcium-transporting ATPase 2 n=1 Tax=Labeo rohita TaxID=84645 RepID=A0ABQ8MVI8_LABRO|nr:Calcium-transporting ATPase 2 [Labeo rohita]
MEWCGEICKWTWEKLTYVAYFSFFILPSLQLILLFAAFGVARGDGAGWICMTAFYLALWIITIYIDVNKDLDLTLTFKKILYVFGSVGVVLLNSVTLMTELILKTVNGERSVGDLRVIVFSSESIFSISLLILLLLGPCE